MPRRGGLNIKIDRDDCLSELDSRTFHGHTFEEDRERDAHLLGEGFTTVRITKRRLTDRPAREADRLRKLLSGEGGIRTLGRG